MNTNQFFSFNRFGLLLKNDLLINYKKYLLTLLVVTAVGFVFLYMNLPGHDGATYRIHSYVSLFMTSLLVLGLFVGLAFPAFNNKKTALNYLLTPASTFEKYTAQVLIRIILATTLFLAIFWIDARLSRFTVLTFHPDLKMDIVKFSYSPLWKNLGADRWTFITIVPTIGFFMFAIRLFFNKNGLIKTLFAFFATVFLIFCFFVFISHVFYPDLTGFRPDFPYYKISEKYSNIDIFWPILFIPSCITLLILGYYKLKEKKI